jgi:hypothetical protein
MFGDGEQIVSFMHPMCLAWNNDEENIVSLEYPLDPTWNNKCLLMGTNLCQLGNHQASCEE